MVLGEGEDGLGGGTKIREQGTHNELMEKKGIYFALVGSQEDRGAASNNLSTKFMETEDSAEGKVGQAGPLRSGSAVSANPSESTTGDGVPTLASVTDSTDKVGSLQM